MRISDWSSYVCSSDLMAGIGGAGEMPLFGERHEIGEMADEHFDPLAEHRGRPTPSGMALRVRLCNFGQEAGRPSLVDSVEKGRSRSKLRAGPERDGSFRELQAATAGTGIGRSR